MMLVVILLSILIKLVSCYDGCEGSDDYRCGDTCAKWEMKCQCGDEQPQSSGFYGYKYMCCTDSECRLDQNATVVVCPNGTRQNLTEPCHGVCNDYPEDPSNGYRGHRACDNGTHCYRLSKLYDDTYDCLDRSDENPFRKQGKQNISEVLAELNPSECITADGENGLTCSGAEDGKCVANYFWCHPKYTYICNGTRTTQDPQLCGNYTFWYNKTCYDPVRYGSGRRCNGSIRGRCVHPYSEHEWATRHCEDESDQVFRLNYTCPEYSAVAHPHCTKTLEDKCRYPEYIGKLGLFRNYEHFYSQCLECFDPTRCTDSCQAPNSSYVEYDRQLHPHCRLPCEFDSKKYPYPVLILSNQGICHECLTKPPPSCQACTNPSYFQCTKSGQCVHPDLRCDLHPQCDQGEDEEDCLEEYKNKSLIPEEALFACRSKYHENVTIWAVSCDGIDECYMSKDEDGCQSGKSLSSKITDFAILVLILVTILVSSYIYRMGLNKLLLRNSKVFEVFEVSHNSSWGDVMKKLKAETDHESKDYKELINLAVLTAKTTDDDDKATKICKVIYDVELQAHESIAAAFCCLKKTLEGDNVNTLLDNVNPGLISKLIPNIIKSLLKWLGGKVNPYLRSSYGTICKVCIIVLILYIDTIKDTLLFLTLVSLIGITAVFDQAFFTYFQVQVVWILGASILLPVFVSAVQIALNSPLDIFGLKIYLNKNQIPKWKVLFCQLGIVVLFPLVPAVTVFSVLKEEENLLEYVRRLEDEKEIVKTARMIVEIKDYLRKTRSLLVGMKMKEILENMIQITVQTIMLCLYLTNTPTTTGFQTVFNSGDASAFNTLVLLVMSVAWSFRTCMSTTMKKKKASFKEFLPGVGGALIGVRSLLFAVTKTFCVVMYFTPYMGLFSILQHWFAEKTSLNKDVPQYKLYGHLFRLSKETVIGTLKQGYLMFLGLIVLHVFLIFVTQRLMSEKLKHSSFLSELQQAVNVFALPDGAKDWSNESDDVTAHKIRRRKHLIEVMSASMIQWLINMIMMVPLWISAREIQSNHQLMMATFGKEAVFKEETEAVERVACMKWLVPTIVTLLWLLDCVMIVLFHYYFHPWVNILKEDTQNEKKNGQKEDEDEMCSKSKCDGRLQRFEKKLAAIDERVEKIENIVENKD